MISAISDATVPKLSVIVRKAYGAGLYAIREHQALLPATRESLLVAACVAGGTVKPVPPFPIPIGR